ncbi:restriction endonuclease subunit S [Candidatus Arsenophonus nilaparvatae]|uniref:restriction endonuclease subunit S n=1 Tax=Candidatus Arsenophonus nilaparvatae TaxID=1247023 RepID=UPI0005099973|nr:restriction endonuclease subunit S [Candidatus Arsenophonus nilaparvatae]
MSNMSFMEKLLNGVEVDYLLLGNVTHYEQPSKYLVKSENYNDEFHVPVLTAGKTFILGYTAETSGIYKASENPVIIFDDFTAANKWVNFDFKAKSSAMKMITSSDENKVLLKYIFYWLNTLPSELVEGDHKRQWISNFSNKKIPIPPFHIQAKIVRILDTFTELTARKKQYNYYRDQLLNIEEGEVEWKTLGEVTLSTSNIRWRDANRSYRYIDLTSVSRENKSIIETSEITAKNAPSRAQKLIEKDDVIFATTRPIQQRLSLINDEYSGEVASTGYCVLRAKNDEVLPKWIYYYISSTLFKHYVEENQSGSAYPAISDVKVKAFKFPIPSLAEQERIIAILDKFDALTNSIIEGLPSEIELRLKQYEYYRDLMLSFSKKKQ